MALIHSSQASNKQCLKIVVLTVPVPAAQRVQRILTRVPRPSEQTQAMNLPTTFPNNPLLASFLTNHINAVFDLDRGFAQALDSKNAKIEELTTDLHDSQKHELLYRKHIEILKWNNKKLTSKLVEIVGLKERLANTNAFLEQQESLLGKLHLANWELSPAVGISKKTAGSISSDKELQPEEDNKDKDTKPKKRLRVWGGR